MSDTAGGQDTERGRSSVQAKQPKHIGNRKQLKVNMKRKKAINNRI